MKKDEEYRAAVDVVADTTADGYDVNTVSRLLPEMAKARGLDIANPSDVLVHDEDVIDDSDDSDEWPIVRHGGES